MATDLKCCTDFLRAVGTEKIEHSDEGFFAHLVAVYRDLQRWGEEEPVCLAGMFHSIYGTEKFRHFALSIERRGEVRELIGERAERIAYLNCALVRSTFDALVTGSRPLRVVDRLTDDPVPLSEQDFQDLVTVHLADWLEQVPRSKEWDYRRDAYRVMAEHLGGIALESFDRVYALAT